MVILKAEIVDVARLEWAAVYPVYACGRISRVAQVGVLGLAACRLTGLRKSRV